MAVPIAVLIAGTVARALAKEAAKQGVKQLTKEQARVVARNSVKGIAKKRSLELSKSKALSGKNLDAAIIRANRSARSTKPVRNAQGLRTTTGQGKSKVTKGDVYQAVKSMSESPNKGSGNISSVGTIKRVQGKPGVRITTRTSGGRGIASRAQGPAKDPTFTAKIRKRSEGPSNKITEKKTVRKGRVVRDVKVTKFEKPPVVSRTVTGERMPFKSTNTEKVTVSKPRKYTTNKNGSAVTVRKTTPRKASEVRKERLDAKDRRVRGLLTPRVNPARPKTRPKPANDRSTRDYNVEGKDTPQGITVRGKFYPDGNPGLPARGSNRQGTIDSRVSDRAEKPTYGPSRRGEQGAPDSEADKLANSALRNLESPKAAAKDNKVKPGKPTKTTLALRRIGDKPSTKAARDAELKRIIRNQRKVLKERELKEAGERVELTKAELAKIRREMG